MAVNPTIPQIIDIAKVSRTLADDAKAKGSLFGAVVDPMLGIQLYIIGKDVEDVYNLNPNYEGLENVALFLYGLCNPIAASLITSGGTAVIPGGSGSIKSPIMITGADFASALSWEGQNSDGIDILPTYTLQVFWNGLNRFLIEGYEFNRTSTGFDIVVNGVTITSFNATTDNISDVFYVFIST